MSASSYKLFEVGMEERQQFPGKKVNGVKTGKKTAKNLYQQEQVDYVEIDEHDFFTT